MSRGQLPVPFPHLDGLDAESNMRLERNWQAVKQAIDGIGGANSGFDAFVIPTLTTDDEDARLFSTVFAAMSYLCNTLGYGDPFIGVYADRALGVNSGPDEVANFALSGAAVSNTEVTLVGIGARWGIEMELAAGGNGVDWNLGDQTCSSAVSFNLYNIKLRRTGTKAYLLGTGTTAATQCQANYFNCHVSGEHLSGGVELPDVFGYRSHFARINNYEGEIYMDSCILTAGRASGATITIGQSVGQNVFMRNCHFIPNTSGNGTIVWSFSGDTVTLINPTWSFNSWHSSGTGDPATISFAGGLDRLVIEGSAGFNSVGTADLVTGSSIGLVRVSGLFRSVDMATLLSGAALDLDIEIESSSTIDGPAVGKVNGRGTDARLTLTGEGNNLQISLLGDDAGTALLDMQNMDDSVITYTARNDAGSSTQPPYSFDSSCARNVMIFEKDNITWGTPTNSGTLCRVIDHNGATTSGGGASPSDYAEMVNTIYTLMD